MADVPEPVPRGRRSADLRVSDEERLVVVEQLRVHFGAGRLELAEFEERLDVALAARNRADLNHVLGDLPDVGPRAVVHSGPPVRQPVPRERRERGALMSSVAFRVHAYVWLVLSVFLIVIWAGVEAVTTTEVPFWPIFPIAAVGFSVGLHGAVRKAQG